MDGMVDVGLDRDGINSALERLFFSRWREPAYEGVAAEPGWHRFTAVGRDGVRERLELRPAGADWLVRQCG